MTSLFISYSRKDIEAARKLTESFRSQGLDFWIDWEGIPPTVDWWQEIEKGIEQADIFLFLISPDSCKSSICQREIEHAAQNGKRLVPVVVRDVKAEEAPQELRQLNWIFLRASDDFDTSFSRLLTAVNTDYEWAQAHRQLQVKALEWERSGKKNAFLLRGEELQESESQLVSNSSKEPHPTDLQREYVLGSRQESDRQRRRTRGIALGVIIALTGLSIFAFLQAGAARTAEATAVSNASLAETARAEAVTESNARATAQANAEANQKLAEERAAIARAGELAAQSVTVRDNDLTVSLLLSVEAFRQANTPESESSLLDAAQADPYIQQYLFRQGGDVDSLGFSPDSKILASAACKTKSVNMWDCGGGEIILWDVRGQRRLGEPLAGISSRVSAVAFSPDGRLLAAAGCRQFATDSSACLQGEIRFWDVETHQPWGQPLMEIKDWVNSLAFTPDGKSLAAGGYGDMVQVFDLATGREISRMSHNSTVMLVAFSPDGSQVLAGSQDEMFHVWETLTGQQITSFPIQLGEDYLTSMAISEDRQTLVTSHCGGFECSLIGVTVWDIESQQPRFPSIPVSSSGLVALSPDGRIWVSSGRRGGMTVWDGRRSEEGVLLKENTSKITSLAFSPDGHTVASGSCGQQDPTGSCMLGRITLWDVTSPPAVNRSVGSNGLTAFTAMPVFSPDSKWLALPGCEKAGSFPGVDVSKCDQGSIILLDMAKQETPEKLLMGHTNDVSSMAYSPNGAILASASCTRYNENFSCEESKILLWNLAAHKLMGRPLIEKSGQVRSLAFSPDGQTLASAAFSFHIQLWDLHTQMPVGEPFGSDEFVSMHRMAFRPGDNHVLASSSDEGMLMLWDLEGEAPTGEVLATDVSGFVFLPDGQSLLSVSSAGNAILWDLDTRKALRNLLLDHSEVVLSTALSPDSQKLALGSCGGGSTLAGCNIILWDLTMGRSIGEPLPTIEYPYEMVFSPDSKFLVSRAQGSSSTLWDLDPRSWIERNCQRAGRNLTRIEWNKYFPEEEYRQTCAQWGMGE